MITLRRRVLACLTSALVVAILPSFVGVELGGGSGLQAVATTAALPLGPKMLAETRRTNRLQPGVTLTSIVRGASDSSQLWTVELNIPATSTSPDPAAPPRALSDRSSAEVFAIRLRGAGFTPRVERVVTPATFDYAGGVLGWRVRIGSFVDQAGADAQLSALAATGFTGASRYTGWDGSTADRGPWRLWVLTIDPARFRGRLVASYGPDIQERETTSALSRATGAIAAVNGGYFVLDPAAGAPGDPAGIGVYDGQVLSESVGRRPALVFGNTARWSQVQRPVWVGSAQTEDGRRLRLDGVNRVPGLIRNCGGTGGDVPTELPRHDFTCTDRAEVVAYTSEFGRSTPAGPGLEAVVDRRHRIVALRSPRGGPLLAGYRTIQATGSLVNDLEAVATVGQRLRITAAVRSNGWPLKLSGVHDSVVNGGPELVRRGRLHVTPRMDGFVRPDDPSFYYGFSAKRNPRTFAGVDGAGRTVLVTADGRSTSSLGLTLVETGAVAKALGLRDALNLDGGGSTTMVANGEVVNQPSDPAGERPVGDALLLLPANS